MKKSRLLGAVCACLATLPFNASAVLINPGDTLYINFTYATPDPAIIDPDLLNMDIIFDQSFGGTIDITLFDNGGNVGQLSDATTASDTGVGDDRLFASFVMPGSPYTFGDTSTTDLSSILDGTTDGLLTFDFTVLSAPIDVSLKQLRIAESTGTNSFGRPAGSPKVILTNFGTSLPSAVPIPPALWLFGSGLLGLIGIARRKKTA
jgi:hypothetical protein